MNLYLLKYNNYFNRKIKIFNTLGEYLVSPYYNNNVIENVNFNPNDGVMTSQIVNSLDDNFDYCILAESTNILSRWFIIESVRERRGQYRLQLRRDLIADNYDEVINAPTFIEKATLKENDPAIFNKENMGFNQIKTLETPLKDETNSAWVVGYIPRDALTEDTTITATATLDGTADIIVDNLSNWDMYQYTTTPFKGNYTSNVEFIGYTSSNYFYAPTGTYRNVVVGFGMDDRKNVIAPPDNSFVIPGITTPTSPGYSLSGYFNSNELNTQLRKFREQVVKDWKSVMHSSLVPLSYAYSGCHSKNNTTEFRGLNGKIIYESSSGIYRRIYIDSQAIKNEVKDVESGNLLTTLDSNLTKQINDGGSTREITSSPTTETYKLRYSYMSYQIRLEQIPVKISATLNSDRYHLEDQPYDMFCIPYSSSLDIYKNGEKLFTSNKSLAINMAIEIGATAGKNSIYDVQLLPYCPVRYCIMEDGTFDFQNAKVNYITDTNKKNIGVILWATTSSFTLNIPYNLEIEDSKISNECDVYRLVSPNYNGQFEFSAAKNKGIQYFNVDCTYIPYNPYIHINPDFNGLYGSDFNDARGLICGGDFSLPQVNNAWADFQQNNKNYQNIFDRQIQNMEFNNKISNIQSLIDTFSSATLLGSRVQDLRGPGAAAGLGIGSGVAGIADLFVDKMMQQEALDYKKDMFGYELGNIKAMPSSLAKTTAFTYNNKIFPILEYYTCTEEEKQALRDKIKYNGMTVMRIGKISDFLQEDYSYIKGSIIRMEGIFGDTNYLNQIADEIYKGVFIK